MDKLLELLQYLFENENKGYIMAEEIAQAIGVSAKYVHRLIDENSTFLKENKITIEYKFRKGYKLVVSDLDLFEKLIHNNHNNERVTQCIIYLLQHEGYTKIENLADSLYLQRSSIDRLIPEMKEKLKKYKLLLDAKPKYGITIVGNEFNKRVYLAHHKLGETKEETGLQIQKILYDVITKNHFELSEMGFNNLVYHLSILLIRIKKGNVVEENDEAEVNTLTTLPIAREIIEKIEKEFHVEVPKNEEKYIALHLACKESLTEMNAISDEVLELVQDILERIKKYISIDLLNDFELRMTLCLHIQPMLTRLKYGLEQENPLTDKIKRELLEGYEMAVIANDVIFEKYKHKMNEDELAFLAMHFALAVEKTKAENKKIKVIIVCTTGKGTARLLQYKLMNQYHLDEENVLLASIFRLKEINLEEYNCILSTITIEEKLPIPVILIDPTLNEISLRKINSFMNKDDDYAWIHEELLFVNKHFKTKEEALNYMISQTKSYFGLDETFGESIKKRETMGSTEVGNQCALPHTFNWNCEHLIFSMMTLDKPIVWNKQEVKCILLLYVPLEYPDGISLSEKITNLVCDHTKIMKLTKQLNKENLVQSLNL